MRVGLGVGWIIGVGGLGLRTCTACGMSMAVEVGVLSGKRGCVQVNLSEDVEMLKQ